MGKAMPLSKPKDKPGQNKNLQGKPITSPKPLRTGPHDSGSPRLDQAGTRTKDAASNSDKGANHGR